MLTINQNNMTKQVKTYRILVVVVPIALLTIACIALQITKRQLTDISAVRKEIGLANQSYESAVNFNAFLTKYQIDLEKMDMAIPGESTIVAVVQDIEAVIQTFDNKATVTFSQATPARIGQDLIVPVSISVTLPLQQLPLLYQQLSALPYMIQMTSSESKVTGDQTITTITMRLYVQEPFTGY